MTLICLNKQDTRVHKKECKIVMLISFCVYNIASDFSESSNQNSYTAGSCSEALHCICEFCVY